MSATTTAAGQNGATWRRRPLKSHGRSEGIQRLPSPCICWCNAKPTQFGNPTCLFPYTGRTIMAPDNTTASANEQLARQINQEARQNPKSPYVGKIGWHCQWEGSRGCGFMEGSGRAAPASGARPEKVLLH